MLNAIKNENLIIRVYQPIIPVDEKNPPRMISGVIEPHDLPKLATIEKHNSEASKKR